MRMMVVAIENAGVSLYKLAAIIETHIGRKFQYIQVKRIKLTGVCDKDVGDVIEEYFIENVPRETLRGVPSNPTMMMQTA